MCYIIKDKRNQQHKQDIDYAIVAAIRKSTANWLSFLLLNKHILAL